MLQVPQRGAEGRVRRDAGPEGSAGDSSPAYRLTLNPQQNVLSDEACPRDRHGPWRSTPRPVEFCTVSPPSIASKVVWPVSIRWVPNIPAVGQPGITHRLNLFTDDFWRTARASRLSPTLGEYCTRGWGGW